MPFQCNDAERVQFARFDHSLCLIMHKVVNSVTVHLITFTQRDWMTTVLSTLNESVFFYLSVHNNMEIMHKAQTHVFRLTRSEYSCTVLLVHWQASV